MNIFFGGDGSGCCIAGMVFGARMAATRFTKVRRVRVMNRPSDFKVRGFASGGAYGESYEGGDRIR